ncbi:MAG TPA: ROK family protein [Candidatus Choladousia intestinigallinarum]|nr:ROK family protein [Candidatus Choladousia intestinigallinarum]
MAISNMEVRRINRNNIFRHILKLNEFSKNEVAISLGLSLPTVTQGVEYLESIGLVEQAGVLPSVGGRRPMSYRCRKNAKVAMGVDITTNHVNIVVVNMALQVLYQHRYKEVLDESEASLEWLGKTMAAAMQSLNIPAEDILGIGFSIPAIVGEDGSVILAIHESMKISQRFFQKLREKTTLPFMMINDANSAAHAECSYHDRKSFVYFFLSNSVGGAYVDQEGKIQYGRLMRAGEFGHMTLHPGGKKCYCGRKGCLNEYCNTMLLSNLTGGNLEQFFVKVREKDAACLEVWETYLDDLSLACHNLLNIYDIPIVLGGYLGEYIGEYIPELERRVISYDSYIAGHSMLFAPRQKRMAAAIGAAGRFVEQFIAGI